MLRIQIEGDEAHVYALLAAMGSHAARVVSGAQPVVEPARSVPVASASTGGRPPSQASSVLRPDAPPVVRGRLEAERVVAAWRKDWGGLPDEQPDRSDILASIPRAALADLQAYVASTRRPWVSVGATRSQAAHISQVGSAMQILPPPQ